MKHANPHIEPEADVWRGGLTVRLRTVCSIGREPVGVSSASMRSHQDARLAGSARSLQCV